MHKYCKVGCFKVAQTPIRKQPLVALIEADVMGVYLLYI